MVQVILGFSPKQCEFTCTLCTRSCATEAGPQFYARETGDLVCRSCAEQAAPALAALRDLAELAQQVGRISRRAPWLPLNHLLDLARVAERYSTAVLERP